MKDWAAQLPTWFSAAEHAVAAGLRLLGQDNEALAFGIVVLGLFLGLAALWAVVLGVLQSFFRLLGGDSRPAALAAGPDLRDLGYLPAVSREEPGRLDVVPSAALAPAARARHRAPVEGPAAKNLEAAPVPSKPEARLAQAAGRASAGTPNPLSANPLSALGGVRRVKMQSLPRPTALGAVVSARPEWTGKVVPGSLEEAGAVEVCKVLSRRVMPGSKAPVRAVDYRICGLPRVDGEGRRQPDVLVYTVVDRGFLPKGVGAKRPD